MNDSEIRERRATLKNEENRVAREWAAYDGWSDNVNLHFMERLSEINSERRELPVTTCAKLGWTVFVLSLLAGAAWSAWRFIL